MKKRYKLKTIEELIDQYGDLITIEFDGNSVKRVLNGDHFYTITPELINSDQPFELDPFDNIVTVQAVNGAGVQEWMVKEIF